MENISSKVTVTNNNRKMSTRVMVSLAMLGAISIILVSVWRFPFPTASFLEYDPADIPILIAAFAYGPVQGLILTVVVSVIQGLTVSATSGGIIGVVMHIFATGGCAFVAGSIYKKNKTRKNAVLALVAGALVQTVAMVIMNMIFTPLFMKVPLETVIALLGPAIIPFNLFKAGINGTVTFILYKFISHYLKGNA